MYQAPSRFASDGLGQRRLESDPSGPSTDTLVVERALRGEHNYISRLTNAGWDESCAKSSEGTCPGIPRFRLLSVFRALDSFKYNYLPEGRYSSAEVRTNLTATQVPAAPVARAAGKPRLSMAMRPRGRDWAGEDCARRVGRGGHARGSAGRDSPGYSRWGRLVGS